MGLLQSRQSSNSFFHEQTRQINQKQFQIISNYSYTHHVDPYYGSNYRLLSHKVKPFFQIEKYSLFFNTFQQFAAYKQNFQWRTKSKYLVQGRALKEFLNINMCASFHEANLYVERIPIRACQITDIPIQQGLYLLYSCFIGFRKIFERTGYFQITLDMICINREAMVKVWLNNNLSKNFPEFYTLNQNYSQTDFLYKLLNICEPLIDFSQVTQKFSSYLKKCCNLSNKNICDNPDKFCRYVTLKQSKPQKQAKQFKSNHNNLSFDIIIQHFEGYLNKHHLMVARQMKSIKDLFRTQAKIQFKKDIGNNSTQIKAKNQTNKIFDQTKNQNNFKLQGLEFINQNGKPRNKKRQNIDTKRSNDFRFTDRTFVQNRQMLHSYKSQQLSRHFCQRNISAENLSKTILPEISQYYKPIIQNSPNLYNPSNLNNFTQLNSLFFKPGRQRIKTMMVPNISFTMKSPSNQANGSPIWKRQKSVSHYSSQNIGQKQSSYAQGLVNNFRQNLKTDITKIENQQPKTSLEKSVIDQHLRQNNDMFKKKSSQLKPRTIYYDLEKQCQIDEEIAEDLQKIEFNRQQQNQQNLDFDSMVKK